jgi:hypothetical protein
MQELHAPHTPNAVVAVDAVVARGSDMGAVEENMCSQGVKTEREA